ncbi:ribosomal RNA small subunit methyltransferase A [Candidatus Dojkabacteria bacterium]|nr:ribosomal RNA small subunit methyltransferase A [Candidatus Dojkabacteria bacterium]
MLKKNHDFKKKFGQNFIKNFKVIIDTLELLEMKESDTILEIGPGDGRFTEGIIPNVSQVDLVEIDSELVSFLKDKFSPALLEQFNCNIEIINEDILNFDLKRYKGTSYKVFGSLPYNISKPIISKFVETNFKPKKCIFIIQKEVAEAYTAKPPKATFLSNYAHIFSDITYEFTVDKQYFHPRPKVHGAVIQIRPHCLEKIDNPVNFSKFLKNAFRTPRKKLINTLKSIYKDTNWKTIFNNLKLHENLRSAEVEFKTWIKIYNEFD